MLAQLSLDLEDPPDFDGNWNGAQNDDEESMIGGCSTVPLNNVCGVLLIGKVREPGSLYQCVCGLAGRQSLRQRVQVHEGGCEANQFELVKCHDLTPKIKCD